LKPKGAALTRGDEIAHLNKGRKTDSFRGIYWSRTLFQKILFSKGNFVRRHLGFVPGEPMGHQHLGLVIGSRPREKAKTLVLELLRNHCGGVEETLNQPPGQ
jgi:hypothetical protein